MTVIGEHRPFDGLTAVVTGAAGDIGSAVVAQLAERGARVIAADRDLAGARAVAEPLDGVQAAHLDLAEDASIDRFASELATNGCAVLVHCAGIARVKPFVDSDPAGWDDMYRVNQRGPMLLTQRLLPIMNAAGFGRLVFVSSDGARAGAGGEAVYAATKASLFGFTKSIARESARYGVTANVVCPGPTEGRMVDEVAEAGGDHLARLTRAIPLRRLAKPAEIADAIVWLSSPTTGYVTGQTVSVSGGITMH